MREGGHPHIRTHTYTCIAHTYMHIHARMPTQARARDEARSATERTERARQGSFNEQAYNDLRARWLPLMNGGGGGGASGGGGGGASGGGGGGGSGESVAAAVPEVSESDRRLARRVANRSELRLIVMRPNESH